MGQFQETMIVGTPVPSLVRWGRSVDADLLYRTLVTFGPRTARMLACELGLSSHRVTTALDELASIGAAQARKTTTRRAVVWTPAAPAEVAASVRRRRPVDGTDQPHHVCHALTDRLIAEAGTFGDGLRHLRTRALTRVRLAELGDVARHEQLAMNPEVVFDTESAQAGVSNDRRLLRRGVRMRVLGLQPADPDPMLRYGRQPSELSPVYREAPIVPLKLFVVDRKIALFPVAPNDFDRGYLEVAQPPLVAALHALFEKHWANSRDPEERTVPQITLGPREQELITLLARGHTDTTAARVLRISTRSISNILRGLMDQLGVENRFQLGLVLGALHVASPPNKPAPPDQEEQ